MKDAKKSTNDDSLTRAEVLGTGRVLAAALAKVNLSPTEAGTWRNDRLIVMNALLPPAVKWNFVD